MVASDLIVSVFFFCSLVVPATHGSADQFEAVTAVRWGAPRPRDVG